jgi:hypothetical protein
LVFIEGEVKNISARKLENIEAVGEFYTDSGEIVKFGDVLVEYTPIMPGQTSPFKVVVTENPQIKM